MPNYWHEGPLENQVNGLHTQLVAILNCVINGAVSESILIATHRSLYNSSYEDARDFIRVHWGIQPSRPLAAVTSSPTASLRELVQVEQRLDARISQLEERLHAILDVMDSVATVDESIDTGLISPGVFAREVDTTAMIVPSQQQQQQEIPCGEAALVASPPPPEGYVEIEVSPGFYARYERS